MEKVGVELAKGLMDPKEQMLGRKEVTVIFEGTQRPEVIFSGFWNGKFIHTAQNVIMRAYKSRRFKPVGEIKGDGDAKN